MEVLIILVPLALALGFVGLLGFLVMFAGVVVALTPSRTPKNARAKSSIDFLPPDSSRSRESTSIQTSRPSL